MDCFLLKVCFSSNSREPWEVGVFKLALERVAHLEDLLCAMCIGRKEQNF